MASPDFEYLVNEIIIFLSLILWLWQAKRISGVLPLIFAGLARWKECVNLETSVKLSHDRNVTAAVCILPFVLAVHRCGLVELEISSNWSEAAQLGVVLALFLLYYLLRFLAYLFFKPKKIPPTVYRHGFNIFRSFFVIATLILLLVWGIFAIVEVDAILPKLVAYAALASVFLVFLIRKTQIFAKRCGFFAAFLYLCALEILPGGILVSAVFFL